MHFHALQVSSYSQMKKIICFVVELYVKILSEAVFSQTSFSLSIHFFVYPQSPSLAQFCVLISVLLFHSLRGAVLIPDLPGWTLRRPSKTQWRRKKKVYFPFFLLFFITRPIIYRFWHIWWVIFHLLDYFCRLAEKRAAIGYTYEDGIVAEPDAQSDKDEDNSENSESEEDEGIPDIGELTCLLHPLIMADHGPFLWRDVNISVLLSDFLHRCGGGCGWAEPGAGLRCKQNGNLVWNGWRRFCEVKLCLRIFQRLRWKIILK